MEAEFWHERWREGQIGFHQQVYNAQMLKHWQSLGLAAGSRIFVPLAGKSMDMAWLASQGHKILGIELNRMAIEAFFEENNLEAEETSLPGYEVFRSQNIEIRCGDFFALKPEDLASVDAVYDRAALIALPPEMRARYAAHMIACLPRAAQMMLVVLEYPQSEMQGPPFSVSEAEVAEFYGKAYNIERLGSVDVPPEGRPAAGQNLSEMFEKTYRLTPKKTV